MLGGTQLAQCIEIKIVRHKVRRSLTSCGFHIFAVIRKIVGPNRRQDAFVGKTEALMLGTGHVKYESGVGRRWWLILFVRVINLDQKIYPGERQNSFLNRFAVNSN